MTYTVTVNEEVVARGVRGNGTREVYNLYYEMLPLAKQLGVEEER